jgi:hypothetical protein
MSTTAISVDEFQALEQKVLRAIEIVKQERAARLEAEAETARLREQLAAQTDAAEEAQLQVMGMTDEREQVRRRVETMLQQMDELL